MIYLFIGILGLVATQQYYHLSQISQSVLPSLCPLTCDPDRDVRDHTFKAMKNFLLKLEKVSEDPSLKESMGEHCNPWHLHLHKIKITIR